MTIHRLLPSALLALLLILALPAFAQDQDDDGLPDSYELAHPCLNVAVPDAALDPDNDNMTSLAEYQYSTSLDPCNADTDGDGLNDGAEVNTHGTDPLVPDTDADGLSDGAEVNTYATNPLNPDTDGDGLDDGEEVNLYGTNPLNQDTDGDGLHDGEEVFSYFTDPLNTDTDGDGLSDGDEVNIYGTNPAYSDTDDDGSADGVDCAKLDSAHWSDCGMCIDADEDGCGADCDLGPDCDDANPNVWDKCATCMDADEDGWYAGCNDYWTIPGPDCNDNNPNVWYSFFCSTCRDIDADGWYVGCNRYLTINGPDCSDTNPNVWNTCATCHDLDADGSYVSCNQYQTINGPDCNDANPLTWDTCATCQDGDGDGLYGLCNRYVANWLSTITVGTGTGSWGYPFYTAWHDSRTQTIYLASEIGKAGTITAIALEVTTIPGQVMNNFTIRMKHTSSSAYPPNAWQGPTSGWTTVYQRNEPRGTTGWRTFTLTTPFAYNGTSNLMVDFSINNSSFTSAGQCRATNTGINRSLYYYTDSGYGDPLTWNGTANPTPSTSTNIPNLRFTINATVSIPGPDCDDANPNAWDTCATCRDGDGDGWHQQCNRYIGINGPDCDDGSPNAWNTCATCRDNDLDGWWVGCNRYLTVNGPDCNDAQAAINPGHAEVFCDSLDNDCNPATIDAPDQDGDGLTLCQEIVIGTSDLNPDTDGDGLTDGYEVNNSGTSPLVADTDGDGLTDGYEVNVSYTCPFVADSDWDRLSDGDEVNIYGTNPLSCDTDDDWLDDYEEVNIYGTSPTKADTDGDGLSDSYELMIISSCGYCEDPPCCVPTDPLAFDTDGDGLGDGYEVYTSHTKPTIIDTDGDGLSDGQEVNLFGTNPLKSDTDSDGLPDAWEVVHACLQAAAADADQDYDADSLTNFQEYQLGTDPCLSDPDGDGMPDGWEILYVSCGLNPNVNDAGLDPDMDTMSNLQEYLAHTNPCVINDTDGDGMPDYYEVLHPCLNPLVNDANADPDGDLWTNLVEYQNATDPCLMIDSDGDLMADWWESAHSYCGLNLLVGDSTVDADGDGLSNLAEYRLNSNPCSPDSDADGITDFDEVNVHHTDPTLVDTDGDGLSDSDEIFIYSTDPLDPDTDADGVNDGTEISHGGNPLDPRIIPAFGKFGPEVRLISGVDYTMKSPSLMWTGSEYGIIWIGTRNGSRGIYISRFDADGRTIGDEKLVIPIVSSYYGAFTAVWTGSQYGLSWNDPRNGYDEIYFARLNPEGDKLGPEVRATFTPARSYELALAWSGSEFGVGWGDWRGEGLYPYFSRLDGQGNKINSDVSLSGTMFMPLDPASLVWTGSEYGLSYLSMYFDPPGWSHGQVGGGLRFSRISSAGSQMSSIWVSGGWHYSYSDLSTNTLSKLNWTGSEFAIIWNEMQPLSCEPCDFPGCVCMRIGLGPTKFARISASGQLLDRITLSTDPYEFPSMDWNGREFGVSWDDGDIWFGRLDSHGNPLSPSQRITNTSAYEMNSSLAWTGSEYGLTWVESVPDDYDDIYFTRIRFDEDGDSLIDSAEPDYGTNPNDWDSDDDEMPDGFEALQGVACGISPLLPDADLDNDSDGLTNLEEYNLGTNPCSADTDGDGLTDQYEIETSHTDPLIADTDSDGLADGHEVNTSLTNPLVADTDGDGLSDGFEVNTSHTNPLVADSDGDGLSDGYEVNTSHTNPMNWDSDGDRLPDGFEVVNGGHAGGGLDALNGMDGEEDFDGDGNSNVNEYWNGSDPWMPDPVPGRWEEPGCFYWGDGDGDGVPSPVDVAKLRMEIAGVGMAYGGILPHTAETLDLDRDGTRSPLDLTLMRSMVAGEEMLSGYASQAAMLEVVSAPTGSVAVGSTTHVTVSVHSASGSVPYAPGFGVVFEVVSGNAVLLGGEGTADGEAAGNRYDVSMEAASGAKANMVVLVTGAGPITIGVKMPGCGTAPYGRWNDEVVLSPEVVINP